MLQLVVKGAIVVASYPADVAVPMDQFPEAALQIYGGDLDGLKRAGPEPEAGERDLRPFAAPSVDLTLYAKQAWQGVIDTGIEVNVAADGAKPKPVLVDGTNATRADLALLALYGQQNPAGSKTWVDDTGVETLLTGEELVRLAYAQGTWVSATYPILAGLLRGIAATPPTVTAPGQIDDALAAAAQAR